MMGYAYHEDGTLGEKVSEVIAIVWKSGLIISSSNDQSVGLRYGADYDTIILSGGLGAVFDLKHKEPVQPTSTPVPSGTPQGRRV